MTSSLRTKAWIALTIASLGLSGCGGKHHDKTPKQVEEKKAIATITPKGNSLTYVYTAQQAVDNYTWTLVDENGKTLKFGGQGNEVTITQMTEQSIKTGIVKIRCITKLGENSSQEVPEQLFTVNRDDINKLVEEAKLTEEIEQAEQAEQAKQAKQAEQAEQAEQASINVKTNITDAIVFFVTQQSDNVKAKYEWTIEDKNGTSLPFYSPDSNEATIARMTEESIRTGINASCTIKVDGKEPNKVSGQFNFDKVVLDRERAVASKNWSKRERMAILNAERAVIKGDFELLPKIDGLRTDLQLAVKNIRSKKNPTGTEMSAFIETMCAKYAKGKEYVKFMREVGEEHKYNMRKVGEEHKDMKITVDRIEMFWMELININNEVKK